MKNWRFIVIIGLISVLGMLYRLYAIGEQPLLEYEANLIQGSNDYVEAGLLPRVMWWHPPLRNILIYLSTGTLGHGVLGVRFWSLALGILTIPLVAFLAVELFRDRRIAYISPFLLAVDPLHITFSRQAIQEAHVAFFAVLGVYFTVRYVKRDSLSSLILAGVAYGLGMASKSQAGFTLAVCWILLIFPKMIDDESVSTVPLYLRIFNGISALLLLPLAIYLASYIPWLSRGYDLWDWLNMQKVSFLFAATTVSDIASNPGRALDWFVRPSGYASIVMTDRPHLTFGFNNLLVWWLVLPSFAYIAYRFTKERQRPSLFISLLFWFSYLPFILIPSRPFYLLSATSVIPFAFIGVSWVLMDVAERYNIERGWMVGYLSLVFLVSLALFPLTCGLALDYSYLSTIVNRFSPH